MKILSNFFVLSILVLSIVLVTSCTDDDKDKFNVITATGGFVRFDENPPSVIGLNQISDLSYAFTLLDANNNVSVYDLKLYADLSGVRSDTVDVAQITTFPTSLSFTANDFASLLNVTVSDIGFGDQFFFDATVTTDNGLVYTTERLSFDDLDDNDPQTFELTGGGITDDIFDEEGYRQAFEFGFVILCPSVIVSDLVGTFDVVTHTFDAFFGVQPPTREVIAGPEPNQLTIIGGAVPLDGADDLIINLNADATLSFGGADTDIHFNTFGPGVYGEITGNSFSCIGVLNITITSPGFIANNLVLRKQ